MAFPKAQPAPPRKKAPFPKGATKKEFLYEGEKDFEPWEMFDKFLVNNMDSSVFNLIDESDVKKAPNVVQWFIGREFLGLDISPPYPKQIQFALELFEDFCPDCSDKRLVQNLYQQTMDEILDRVVLLEFGVCPKCKKNRGEFVESGIFTYPDELAICGGQRIGKSFEIGLIASYQLHRFLTLGVPYRYFHQQPSSVFHMTFTAVDFTQAMDNLFEPFAGMIGNSPWFTEYHETLDYFSGKHGLPPQWEFPKQHLGYVHKRLNIGPATPNFRKMRGRTRFFFSIDEIGWFDFGDDAKKKVTLSADGVYAALNNSLRTIRSEAKAKMASGLFNVPTALAVNASSPSNINDKIMKLIREGANMPSRKVFHLATWEAHPRMTYADIAAEITNPIELARDFEAVPPLAASPFIHDDDTVFRAIGGSKQYLTGITKYHTDDFGKKSLHLELGMSNTSKQVPRVLSIDPGLSHDSFGMSLLSFFPPDITFVDDVLECKPEPGCPVNFHLLFNECIVPIIEKFHIVAVVYDQWQSQMQMDEMQTKYGVLSEQITLVWDDFVNFRSALISAKLRLPAPEKPAEGIKDPATDIDIFSKGAPRLKLIAQLLMVNEVGRKVTKPQGCSISDDIFRSIVVGEKYIREHLPAFLKGRFRTAGAGALGQLQGYTPNQGIGGRATIKAPLNQYGATKYIQHQSTNVGVVAGRHLVQGPQSGIQNLRGVKRKPKSLLFYGDR